MIRSWLKERRIVRAATARVSGYNYAAGQLLRGRLVHEIADELDSAIDETDEARSFTRGARDALTQWKWRGLE